MSALAEQTVIAQGLTAIGLILYVGEVIIVVLLLAVLKRVRKP